MNNGTDVVVAVRGLQTRFGNGPLIHENLELDVLRGEVLGLVGGSGTGKSVLLRIIVGLITARAGSIRILGEETADHEGLPVHLQQRIGVQFQDGALFSSLTVAENIEVPLREHAPRLSGRLRRALVALKIAQVGLPADAAGKLPSQLSGGMRKRAGLARALALDPDLLFLDEPTAGLDPIGAASYDQLILKLQANLGLTVVMITHDLDSLYTITDRIAVLGDKRVLATAPVAELERFDHPWIQAYFHGPRARAAQAQQQPHAATQNQQDATYGN
jgi:phospholipid/cholesterol/gamma-HCH transport system ATP-binding protein